MRQGVYSAPKYLNNYSSPVNKKWPEDIQCIIKSPDPSKGSLYLSNVEAAQNPATVKKLNVGAILSCAKGYIISHPKSLVPHYKYIPGQDKQSFDISLHFDQAVQFISQALQKTNIIVHCIAGVSRSVSMVIAYFMKCRKFTYNQAFHEVKSKRKIISPNDGFIMHLKRYEQKLKSTTNTNINKIQGKIISSQQKNKTKKQIQIQDDNIDMYQFKSKQYYTPKKTIQYYKSIQMDNDQKNNPENMKYYEKNSFEKMKYQSSAYYLPAKYESTLLYSPTRNKDVGRIGDYRTISKSVSLHNDNGKQSHNNKNQKNLNTIINSEQNKLNSYESKDFSPRKSIDYTNYNNNLLNRNDLIYGNKKTGYFDSMNKQLNQKIQQIRRKYEQQRVEMMKSYNSRGYSGQKQRHNVQKQRQIGQKYRNIYTDRQNQKLSRDYTNNVDDKLLRSYTNVGSIGKAKNHELQRNNTNINQMIKTSGSFKTPSQLSANKNILQRSTYQVEKHDQYKSRIDSFNKTLSSFNRYANTYDKAATGSYSKTINSSDKKLDNLDCNNLSYKYNSRYNSFGSPIVPRVSTAAYALPYSYSKRLY